MKNKIISLLKKYNCRMENYNSYRSDMGWHVFEILVFAPNNKSEQLYAGYVVGSSINKAEVLPMLEKDLQRLCQ